MPRLVAPDSDVEFYVPRAPRPGGQKTGTLRDGAFAAGRLLTLAPGLAQDAALLALAREVSSKGVEVRLEALALAAREVFSALRVPGQVKGPDEPESAAAEPESGSNSGSESGKAHVMLADSARVPAEDISAVSRACGALAGTGLRTILGRIASGQRQEDPSVAKIPLPVRRRKRKTDGLGDEGAGDGDWRRRLHEYQSMLRDGPAPAARAVRRACADAILCLPRGGPAVFCDVLEAEHGGRGAYVAALLAGYAVARALGSLPDDRARREVYAIAVAYLVEIHPMARADAAAVRRAIAEQNEASKRKKISVYDKSLEFLEDRDMLREMQRIQGLDYEGLDDEFGSRPPPEKTDVNGAGQELQQQPDVESNFFMSTPGEEDDAFGDHEFEYEG
jgi:hypothetical protein